MRSLITNTINSYVIYSALSNSLSPALSALRWPPPLPPEPNAHGVVYTAFALPANQRPSNHPLLDHFAPSNSTSIPYSYYGKCTLDQLR